MILTLSSLLFPGLISAANTVANGCSALLLSKRYATILAEIGINTEEAAAINGYHLYKYLKLKNPGATIDLKMRDKRTLAVHLLNGTEHSLFCEQSGHRFSLDLNKVDIERTLLAAEAGNRPLLGVASKSIEVGTPESVDRNALLAAQGYELVDDMAPLSGMTEQQLYINLFHAYGPGSLILVQMPDGNWARAVDQRSERRGGAWIHICFVERIHLPEFERYLSFRMQYLHARFNENTSFEAGPEVEVRIGSHSATVLHYDQGVGSMVETLNRDKQSGGTYFVGEDNKAHENPVNNALLLSGDENALGPAGLHAAPPLEGTRIFIRYGIHYREINARYLEVKYEYK